MSACPGCAAPVEDGSAYCEECGSALAVACPSCGGPVTPGKRFCRSCGAALAAPVVDGVPAPAAAALAPSAETLPVAERRVCSVLFCDLVGFTSLSEARDPEEVRELLGRYFELARSVIDRYGGVVEKFIGDAVMAVWGTPVATEDDAERSVRAGLELVDAVAGLGEQVGAAGLAARAGVVTGSVAVTLGATGQGMVAGDAVNTAARVQAAAEAGTVLVDEGTWQVVARAGVGFAAAGEHPLKGKAEPVRLWRADRVVSGMGGAQRVDGLEAGFVGRGAELRLVKELFHACEQRRTPRLVAVSGAAGVGKSRLGWEFEKYVDGLADTVWWHRGRCLSYGDGVAFWALAQMVRQRLGIAEDDPSTVAGDKLVAGLERWLADPAERDYVGLRLGQLLGVSVGGTAAAIGPAVGRDELFAGWRVFFERLAAQHPVVLVVEDLQHADAGLLDFVEHLLDWARDVSIFVLTLARPELDDRRPGWGAGRRTTTTLTLDPLDPAAMDQLLDGLVPGMPDTAKVAVAARAEGIPLYAVETVRMLVDRDQVQPVDGVYRLVGDVGELAVPATLHSLLAARLDALDPDARRLVADAAVLGSTFPAEALVGISGRPDSDVRRILVDLVRREVLGVRADPLSPERGHYGFVQTMLRQVAYDTLSRHERKARHLAVADHLRTAFADDGEEVAEVIATHLLDALAAVPDAADAPQLRDQAVDDLTRAAERAVRTGASATAATVFDKAANLLDHVGTSAADLAAAPLHTRAGAAAGTAGDYPCAETHHRHAARTFRKHHRLLDAARADVQAGRCLGWLGRLEDARMVLSAALVALGAESTEDIIEAMDRLAYVEINSGKPKEADRLLTAALDLAESHDLPDRQLAQLLGTRAVWHQRGDRPAQATAYLREALHRSRASQDTVSISRMLNNLADNLLTFEPAAAADAAREAAALARHVGDRDHLRVAIGNLVQALLLIGDWDQAAQCHGTAGTEDGLGGDPFLAFSGILLTAFRGQNEQLPSLLTVLDQWTGSEDHQDLAEAATAFAAVAHSRGDHASSLQDAQRALAHADALGLRSDGIFWAWPLAADAALALGDQIETTRLIEWLDAHPPGHVPPVLRAERLRVGARLLDQQADPEAAAAFHGATAALRGLGSPYHLAAGLLDHAEHVATTGDREAFQPLAAEAAAIADRLGARPLTQRATALTASIDVTTVPG